MADIIRLLISGDYDIATDYADSQSSLLQSLNWHTGVDMNDRCGCAYCNTASRTSSSIIESSLSGGSSNSCSGYYSYNYSYSLYYRTLRTSDD